MQYVHFLVNLKKNKPFGIAYTWIKIAFSSSSCWLYTEYLLQTTVPRLQNLVSKSNWLCQVITQLII